MTALLEAPDDRPVGEPRRRGDALAFGFTNGSAGRRPVANPQLGLAGHRGRYYGILRLVERRTRSNPRARGHRNARPRGRPRAVRSLRGPRDGARPGRSRGATELRGELHAFDAGRPEALGELLDAVRPAAVRELHRPRQAARGGLAAAPARSRSTRSSRIRSAAAAAERGARLIHVSTDCVFSGELEAPRRYTEDDAADARDLYGLQQAARRGERAGRAHASAPRSSAGSSSARPACSSGSRRRPASRSAASPTRSSRA